MDALLEESPLRAGILYRLLSGSVCPRPIAWVATQDKQGNANLAPFSFFNVASIAPPILAFSPLLDGRHVRRRSSLLDERLRAYYRPLYWGYSSRLRSASKNVSIR